MLVRKNQEQEQENEQTKRSKWMQYGRKWRQNEFFCTGPCNI
jgi:hypothetical protein